MIRFFDIIFSAFGLVVLAPVFAAICLKIKLGSKGGCFYIQERIGKDGKPFGLYKFRTMRIGADNEGIGYFLRKTKMDELPQLLNVLKGEMSLVGPRPEVRKYVELYTEEQRKVLSVRPGITDYASIEYVKENELLSQAEDPERTYIEQVMPDKIKLNMRYLEHYNLIEYFKIILLTFKSLVS